MKHSTFSVRLLPALLLLYLLAPARLAVSSPSPDADPWSPSQTVTPADFAMELQKHNPSLKIVYVGVRTLYTGAHIPGAVFRGPGAKQEGILDLKKYAAGLPKDSKLVIYCGCCPLERCPNLRPAFSVLQEMGFTHLRVLSLPTSFAADWVEKGYPTEKGS